jgi:hypothetical protein
MGLDDFGDEVTPAPDPPLSLVRPSRLAELSGPSDLEAARPELVKAATKGLVAFSGTVYGWLRKQPSEEATEGLYRSRITALPKLTESDRELGEALWEQIPSVEGEEHEGAVEEPRPAPAFDDVVGLEHEKAYLIQLATAPPSPPGQERRHALIWGGPGTAKSLMLDRLQELPDTRWVSGTKGAITESGVLDILRNERPHILLIDEIDKMDPSVQSAILSAMDGKIGSAKHGDQSVIPTQVRVVATANHPEALIEPLRDRFWELKLPEYNAAQQQEVIQRVLEVRHKTPPAQAEQIARLVAPAGGSVRRAEAIAAMWAENPELAREMADRLPDPARSPFGSPLQSKRGQATLSLRAPRTPTSPVRSSVPAPRAPAAVPGAVKVAADARSG